MRKRKQQRTVVKGDTHVYSDDARVERSRHEINKQLGRIGPYRQSLQGDQNEESIPKFKEKKKRKKEKIVGEQSSIGEKQK